MGFVFHAAILRASADDGTRWGSVAEQLLPGAHAILMGDTPTWQWSNINARRAGLEVRDTVAVLSPTGLSFAVLLRKPLVESSLTAQLLKTGTGALNIDATRIASDLREFFSGTGKPRSGMGHAHGYGMGGGFGGENANPPNKKGRWPSNLVFVHGGACQNEGVKRALASSGVSKNKPITAVRRSGAHAQAGGHQTIGRVQPVFCTPGCPVAALDQQSGVRPSTLTGRADPNKTHVNPGDNHGKSWYGGGNSQVYADSGGASRYYKQFKNHNELRSYLVTLILPSNGSLLDGFPS